MKTVFRNFITTLRRFKLASGLNLLGLAAAFAAFVIILIQVNYEYGFDRFHAGADRIFRVEVSSARQNIPAGSYTPALPLPLAEAIRDAVPQIERVAVADGRERTLNVVAEREGNRTVYEETTREVSDEWLALLGVRMAEGDAATALDEPGAALIPESMARKFFGSEPALGRLLAPAETDSTIGVRRAVRVGGVYRDFPRNSIFSNIIYLPVGEAERNLWSWSNYQIYLQLASTGEAEEVERAIGRIDYPDKSEEAKWRLMPLADIYYAADIVHDMAPKGSRTATRILLAIAVLVIAVAGINFVNFSMALAPVRMKNINTRKILGSSVAALRAAQVAEAAMTAAVAYAVALGMVAYIGRSALGSYFATSLLPGDNGGVVLLGAAIAVLTGAAAGLYPAIYSTSFPPALAVKGNFGLSPKGRTLRNVLVGFQFSVSMVLIICAAFMNLQNSFLATRAIGMNRGGVVEMPVSKKIFADRQSLFNELENDPAVEGVALSMAPMFRDCYDNLGVWFRGEVVEFGNVEVTSQFTELMGIRIAEGRGFVEEDDRAEPGTRAIFNRTACRKYGLELGDRLEVGAGRGVEVVGIMEDVNFESLHKPLGPFALMNVGNTEQSYLPTAYVRIGAGGGTAVLGRMAGVVAALDPNAVVDVHFLDETVEAQYRDERRIGSLITGFSLLAIVISMAGVFGLVVFETQYRRKEIGVRKVMGATVAEILAMFNRSFVRLVLICFVVAAPLAWYGVREWLGTFAYRTPVYWWVFAVSLLIVLAITLATVTIQSWRAATANPVEAFKTE
ncbi:ABC transporter permease [uncultured Rikenella sp.]|uniref:ABC transporter permease n=1 Tax=uncultured Rikenella sp. TaxID=368003 RepID=UPI00262FC4E6|nr:ABC transporter permease [uncultured Rikenella sp.]